MRMALAVLALFLCTQSGGWAADAASAPVGASSRVNVGHVARSNGPAQDAPTQILACSPAWQKKVNRCNGQECGELYSQATLALQAEYDKFVSDLANPAPFVAAQKSWVAYRDANCDALAPTCPEGQGGSCELPSAACRAALNCSQIKYLVQGECSLLNGYNERAGFVEPDRCNAIPKN
jgi:uncharacterized protein YecT (DUF1311 family)